MLIIVKTYYTYFDLYARLAKICSIARCDKSIDFLKSCGLSLREYCKKN